MIIIFSIDGKIVTDAYAKGNFQEKKNGGIVPTDIRGSIVSSEFDWQNDAPLEDLMMRQLYIDFMYVALQNM